MSSKEGDVSIGIRNISYLRYAGITLIIGVDDNELEGMMAKLDTCSKENSLK